MFPSLALAARMSPLGASVEPERVVQEAALGDRDPAAAKRRLAEQGVGNGGDAVALRVGDVQRAFESQGDAGGADDERGLVGALGEAVRR